jgi:hypothetical protein
VLFLFYEMLLVSFMKCLDEIVRKDYHVFLLLMI